MHIPTSNCYFIELISSEHYRYSLTKSLFDNIYQIKYRSGKFINIKKALPLIKSYR
jgi:hypothetical protein